MILLIDNYDSFSYNLYQLIGSINPEIQVVRNDAMTVEEIDRMRPEAIVLSPGPGRPENAGVCLAVVQELGEKYPILGVCLGHQSICQAYGATITYAKRLMHGKRSMARLTPACPLFQGCPEVVPVARYHSLAAEEPTLPDCLTVVARTEENEIMAVMHREKPVFGFQFHPESIMTPHGKQMVKNFLQIAEKGMENND